MKYKNICQSDNFHFVKETKKWIERNGELVYGRKNR